MPAIRTAEGRDPTTGRFRPGFSGNPSGQHGSALELRAAARNLSAEALEIVHQKLYSDNEKVQLMAAEIIFDRAFGKPAAAEHEVKLPEAVSFSALSDAQLDRIMEIIREGAQ